MALYRARTKLPDTLHELIRVAIQDAKTIRKDDRYVMHMNYYYHPFDDYKTLTKKCYVCFAGAVMANRLLPRYFDPISTCPGEFSEGIYYKLRALDCIRMGELEAAIELFYINNTRKPYRYLDKLSNLPAKTKTKLCSISPYQNEIKNWQQFLKDMNFMANVAARIGA